jgi:hypothetical protein
MTISSVRFGKFHLGHLRPGQYLGRFASDNETLLEIIQVVSRPVAEYPTSPGRMRLSIPVDSYVLDANSWQYQRGGALYRLDIRFRK